MKKFYVLSILLGLLSMSCSNFNTTSDELNKNKENKLLKELRSDLAQNLVDINSNIEALTISENANRITIDLIENAKPYHDSLDYQFANLYPYLVFAPNETTFEYLKEVGLTTISNDSIRNKVSDLYAVQYEVYKSFERIYFVEHYTNYIKPMFIAEFETFKFYRSFKPRNYNLFIKNPDYKQILSYSADACESFKFLQFSLKENIKELIADIDEELSN